MKKKYNITFLIDPTNNWIEKFILRSFKKKNKRFIFKFKKKYNEITNQDVVFFINYTKIIPKKFLNKNNLNLVIHASNLPKGKGFAPLQWQILEKKKKITLCLIEAVEKFDSGPIILKDFFYLNGSELNE